MVLKESSMLRDLILSGIIPHDHELSRRQDLPSHGHKAQTMAGTEDKGEFENGDEGQKGSKEIKT